MMLAIGYGAFLPVENIRWISPYEGAATKRLRKTRDGAGLVVDLTRGHPAASLVGLENREVIVSAVSTEALQRRYEKCLQQEKKGLA